MSSWDHTFWRQQCKREEKLFESTAQHQLEENWHQDWLENSPGLMAIKGWPMDDHQLPPIENRPNGTTPRRSKPDPLASRRRHASPKKEVNQQSVCHRAHRTSFEYMTRSPTYKVSGDMYWFSQPSPRAQRSARLPPISARRAMAVAPLGDWH